MSWTKNYYHEEICAMNENLDDYWRYQAEGDETEVDWFPEQLLAHDGYTENLADFAPDFMDEDLPF